MRVLPLLLVCLLFLGRPTVAALNTWRQEALKFLNGSSFKCAHIALPRGDGFFRLKAWQPQLQDTLDAAPPYTEIPLNVSDITGLSVDTLEALKSTAEEDGCYFDIKYAYYRVPNWSESAALESALYQYDCLLSSTFITSDRVAVMDYMLPHAPFGFQVLTAVPTVSEPQVYERILACLKPFSSDVWLTILGLVVLSAILIGMFEGGWGANIDFHWWQRRRAKLMNVRSIDRGVMGPTANRKESTSPAMTVSMARFMDGCDRYGYSTFRSVTALTTGESVNPHTAAGRLYIAGLSIVFVILISSYTANLAAQLTMAGLPVQKIRSINDFMARGQVCCVRNSTVHLAYVRSNYPRMKIHIVNETSERALAMAIEAGLCAGAITTNVHLRYFLANDQDYACKMVATGDVLNFGYYAIPWSLPTALATRGGDGEHSIADAMSLLMGELLDSGKLNELLLHHFPHTGGFQCDEAANDGPGSLALIDLSGVFIIQAIIALCSILLFIVLKLKSRSVRSRAAEVVNKAQEQLVQKPITKVWEASRRLSGAGSLDTSMRDGGSAHRSIGRGFWVKGSRDRRPPMAPIHSYIASGGPQLSLSLAADEAPGKPDDPVEAVDHT